MYKELHSRENPKNQKNLKMDATNLVNFSAKPKKTKKTKDTREIICDHIWICHLPDLGKIFGFLSFFGFCRGICKVYSIHLQVFLVFLVFSTICLRYLVLIQISQGKYSVFPLVLIFRNSNSKINSKDFAMPPSTPGFGFLDSGC